MTNQKNLQDDIFLLSEGNQWFIRNKETLGKRGDLIIRALELFNIRSEFALEIGCSNGYRLDALKKNGRVKNAVGIEPSQEAIADGKTKYPSLDLRKGTAASLPVTEKEMFDLVIVNFVFHWIDRKTLLKSIEQIDGALKEKGFLIIGDFAPSTPTKVRYHHIPDKQVWTYKQDYAAIFASSNMYNTVAKLQASHDDHEFMGDIMEYDRMGITILQKNSEGNYVVGEYRK